jgi:endonuclease/exonuclease/phosphatase family metal-dependent hydrolase
MKRSLSLILAFALFFLFFIQMAGILVESIYILDLMSLGLDARALAVLFFFTPVILLPFRKRWPAWTIWLLFAILFVARGLVPYVGTALRLVCSGAAVGTILLLFPTLVTARGRGESARSFGLIASIGLALALTLSVLLRTLEFSLDYSLTSAGGWIGWGLGLLLGWTLTRLEWERPAVPAKKTPGATGAVIGIVLVLTLGYFAFSAPAVIARWTAGSYPLIVGAVSLLSVGWAVLLAARPGLLRRLSPRLLLLWNGLFTLSLAGTLLAHRVSFPASPDSPVVIVGAPTWLQQIPLALMLLLFPVLFADLSLFFTRLRQADPEPRALVPGLLLGSLILVVLVFANVFTNVWGYIEPVSTPFRNQFWLPYFLAAAGLTALALGKQPAESFPAQGWGRTALLGWAVVLGAAFLATLTTAVSTDRPRPGDPGKTSLLVLTYNIQAGNDTAAERSYDRQLALMQRLAPDLIALQETDTARLSINNDDLVRYFAGKLGYYSYYGPTTVTGTYGAAILSRYPLRNVHAVFSYSDRDEVGTSEAEITVGGKTLLIRDVHPDGSPAAKLAFARAMLQADAGRADVIMLGDFNMRIDNPAYQLLAATYPEAWTLVHAAGLAPDGTDVSDRIDHILISPDLGVRDPVYLPSPASASDHPAHWAVVYWEK